MEIDSITFCYECGGNPPTILICDHCLMNGRDGTQIGFINGDNDLSYELDIGCLWQDNRTRNFWWEEADPYMLIFVRLPKNYCNITNYVYDDDVESLFDPETKEKVADVSPFSSIP